MGAPTLWNMFPSSVKSVAYCYVPSSFKDIQPCLSNMAPGRINQSDDNWNYSLTLRLIKQFVFMGL